MGVANPTRQGGRFVAGSAAGGCRERPRDHSPALHQTAERMEKELGDERQLKLFAEEAEQKDLAPPDGQSQ